VTLILEFTFPANTVLLVLRVDDESGLDSEFIRWWSKVRGDSVRCARGIRYKQLPMTSCANRHWWFANADSVCYAERLDGHSLSSTLSIHAVAKILATVAF
jgi:hypothetical protein